MTTELYLENSYLKECESQIESVDGNLVILEQTIFYPGGGGIYEVVKVTKKDGKIIHVLDRPLKETSPVTLQIDWSWRYQNMRYHTLLHVISGYLYQHYNGLATSSQIEKDHSRLEITFSAEIIDKIPFEQLEQSIKELLKQSYTVSTKIITKEEAEQKEGIIKTTVSLLPPSLKKIRIVQIQGIDEQACGGTHVHNTSEIGDFSIIKIQNKGATKRRIKLQLN